MFEIHRRGGVIFLKISYPIVFKAILYRVIHRKLARLTDYRGSQSANESVKAEKGGEG